MSLQKKKYSLQTFRCLWNNPLSDEAHAPRWPHPRHHGNRCQPKRPVPPPGGQNKELHSLEASVLCSVLFWAELFVVALIYKIKKYNKNWETEFLYDLRLLRLWIQSSPKLCIILYIVELQLTFLFFLNKGHVLHIEKLTKEVQTPEGGTYEWRINNDILLSQIQNLTEDNHTRWRDLLFDIKKGANWSFPLGVEGIKSDF